MITVTVAHSGGRDCFIPGGLLKAVFPTDDYHRETDGNNFTRWVEERLILNLEQPSAIVMDLPQHDNRQIPNLKHQEVCYTGVVWAPKREKLILLHANNKGTDQLRNRSV